jgi:hypothetical protein
MFLLQWLLRKWARLTTREDPAPNPSPRSSETQADAPVPSAVARKAESPSILRQQKDPESDDGSVTETSKYALPRRPASGYLLFCTEKRAEIFRENSGLPVKAIVKRLGELWTNSSIEFKNQYNERAAQDQLRYRRQKREYDEKGSFYDENHKRIKIERVKRRFYWNKKKYCKAKVLSKKKIEL